MKIPGNPFKLLQKLTPKPLSIPASQLKGKLSKEEIKIISKLGMTLSELSKKIELETTINYDRSRFYTEVTKALEHWFVGPALGLYADYATSFNQLHNASVWITSKSSKYQKELTKLLERIGIEERILDWGWTVGGYGDLFLEVKGQPELGIVSINDDEHPLNISRIDHEGCLIGFYKTPQGNSMSSSPQAIIPPWQWVHARLMGAKRKRSVYGDPMYAEFRTMHMMTGIDTRQISSRYGVSLLVDALPTYKRLRLAEDSLLMARLTRGILRYIWKLRVNSQNAEATEALMSQMTGILKKARALDTSDNSPNFDSKFSVLANNEDLIIPVWGDSTNDLSVEKIGGDVDIRWIVDVEELRQQLACTLRVPLSLLGGYTKEATGPLGSEAIEKLDIGFARAARRLQRALKEAIKRICQIHLAYMNMDPDPALFDVCMNEGSTAEEEQARDSLNKGMEVVQKMLDTIDAADPDHTIDRKKIIDYLNKKILKLEDFDLNNFLLNKVQPANPDVLSNESLVEAKDADLEEARRVAARGITNSDLMSYLPLNENAGGKFFDERHMAHWKSLYENVKVVEEKVLNETKPDETT